jgi:hypothetical protein
MTDPLTKKTSDDGSTQPRKPAGREPSLQTARLFPDVPPELIPRSLDRSELSSREAERAAQAIDGLQEKMTGITAEFAQGRVNQAQFQAIYTRYCEQKVIIERILAQDPQSTAWQTIAADGYTGFLRRQYAADVIGMLIIEMLSGETLQKLGQFELADELLVPILTSLVSGRATAFETGVRSTQIEGGLWLSFVPGEYSASVIIFSHEPSLEQLKTIINLQRDFERANRQQLMLGRANPTRLAFPQRALFEDL